MGWGGGHTWCKVLLSPSWNSWWFLREGSRLSIFPWAPRSESRSWGLVTLNATPSRPACRALGARAWGQAGRLLCRGPPSTYRFLRWPSFTYTRAHGVINLVNSRAAWQAVEPMALALKITHLPVPIPNPVRLAQSIRTLLSSSQCHSALIDSIKAGEQTVPRTDTDVCQPGAYCRAEHRESPCVCVPLWQIHRYNLYNKVWTVCQQIHYHHEICFVYPDNIYIFIELESVSTESTQPSQLMAPGRLLDSSSSLRNFFCTSVSRASGK